jgi:hypothetical protein
MTDAANWLILVHQLPAKPAYALVKVWRLLRDTGAVSVKNSLYILPLSAEPRTVLAAILRPAWRRRAGRGSAARLQVG